MKHCRAFFARTWAMLGAVSVRAKIMGMILGLTFLLGFGVTLQVRMSMSRTLGQELEQRGVSVARDVAARSADPILIRDTYALYQLLGDTVANNPDLRYAFLLDEHGQVLVHSFSRDEGKAHTAGLPPGLIAANRVVANERHHWQVIDTNEGPMYDFAVPIFEGRAGTARIGLSESRMRETVDAVTRQLLLTTVAVAIIGVGAAAFLTWLLTRPILELVSVTRAVARGDLSRKAGRLADDEIGRLSDAFNQMVDDLAVAQQQSEAFNQELLRRNRELAVLNAVADAVRVPLELEPLLERALERVLRLLDLEAGWVTLTDPAAEGGYELAGAVGIPRDIALRETRDRFPDCPCGRVLETAESTVIAPLHESCPVSAMTHKGGGPITCHAAIPLIVKSRVLGLLAVAAGDPSRFGDDQLRLLTAIGAQLAVAIENAQLWAELKTKEAVRGQLLDKVIYAQEEERKRIARELHDETSQALTSFMVDLKLVERADSADAVRVIAEQLRRRAAEALENVRSLALELRPSMLDDMGLIPALERYTQDFSSKTGTTVDFHAQGLDGTRLLPRVETALYRVVQEALANVSRHAQADTVSVLLERQAARLVVIVEDNGRGFDADRLLRSGSLEEKLGLYGMQERASLVGGELAIESRPGAGTTVFVEIPLDEIQGQRQ